MSLASYFPTVPALSFRHGRLPRYAVDGHEAAEWRPRADVYEKDDAYEVTVELPGLGKDDVKISAEDGVLNITGERQDEHTEEAKNYYRRERVFGAFKRSFRLPEGVDAEKIGATFSNGLLTLSVPKAAEIMPRAIEITD